MPPGTRAELRQIGRKTVYNGFLEVPYIIAKGNERIWVVKRLAARFSLPFIIGFALNFAWVSSVFFQGALFVDAKFAPTSLYFYFMSLLVLTATLTVVACLSKHLHKKWTSKPLLIITGVTLCLGTLLTLFASLESLNGGAAFIFGVILTGVGSAYVLMVWGWYIARRVTEPILSIAAAYALATIIFFLLSLLPSTLFIVIVCILPATSLAVFARFRCDEDTSADRSLTLTTAGKTCDAASAANAASTTSQTEFLARTCVAGLLFGVALGLMNSTLRIIDNTTSSLEYAAMFGLTSEIPLLLLLGYFSLSRDRYSIEEQFATAYRVALLVMIGSLLLANAGREIRFIFHVIALSGYICFKMMLWALFAHIAKSPNAHPIRVFASGEACLSGGLLLGNAAVYLFSAFATVTESGIRNIIAICIAILLVTFVFLLNERKVIAIVSTQAAENPKHQRFRAHCEKIASLYGLSKREAEVFTLFARGRSQTRIADDLYISSGTVSTHLRNIYRKLNVHSRQELIDLIEYDSR
jgi:DNA-binding CsgD family transcriptional regulator